MSGEEGEDILAEPILPWSTVEDLTRVVVDNGQSDANFADDDYLRVLMMLLHMLLN